MGLGEGYVEVCDILSAFVFAQILYHKNLRITKINLTL